MNTTTNIITEVNTTDIINLAEVKTEEKANALYTNIKNQIVPAHLADDSFTWVKQSAKVNDALKTIDGRAEILKDLKKAKLESAEYLSKHFHNLKDLFKASKETKEFCRLVSVIYNIYWRAMGKNITDSPMFNMDILAHYANDLVKNVTDNGMFVKEWANANTINTIVLHDLFHVLNGYARTADFRENARAIKAMEKFKEMETKRIEKERQKKARADEKHANMPIVETSEKTTTKKTTTKTK